MKKVLIGPRFHMQNGAEGYVINQQCEDQRIWASVLWVGRVVSA